MAGAGYNKSVEVRMGGEGRAKNSIDDSEESEDSNGG